jgi:hypothetical protein
MAFWRRLLEGTSWQTLIGYVSPTFFQLVSPRDVSRSAYRLARNWFDEGKYVEAVNLRAKAVDHLDFGLSVTGVARRKRDRLPFRSEAPKPQKVGSGCRTGESVLALFFHQIIGEGPLFLDLRRGHFLCAGSTQNAKHTFVATPLYCVWSPEFRNAMRELYAGFYGNVSSDVYRAALRSLGIEAVADIFDKAFGGERKIAASFQLADFKLTFHEVFTRCLETRSALHPDFLTLGIAIATLYDHLELDGGTYNVAECYARALGTPAGFVDGLRPLAHE